MKEKPEKEKFNLKVFGYGLALIIGFFAVKIWFKHGWQTPHVFLILASSLFFFITTFYLEALKPFYRQWMKVAHALGAIVTQVLLTGLFFGLFAPIGILLRLLRKDFLDRTIDVNKISYWIARETQLDKNRYKQQF